jgi:hypothetical protein
VLAEVLDDADEFVVLVAVVAGEPMSSRARVTIRPCSGVPVTVMPLPRRNSRTNVSGFAFLLSPPHP